MKRISHKNKIFALLTVYILGCLVLFSYGFGVLDNGNATAATAVNDKRKQLNDLENEQRSFQLGSQDLQTLAQKPYQPANFFTKDVRVVNEIKTLEALGSDNGLDFVLSVSGTASSGTKTLGVGGDIYSIPYTMTLTGPFAGAVTFLEQMEQLSFVSSVQSVSITALDAGRVRTTLNALFYITK